MKSMTISRKIVAMQAFDNRHIEKNLDNKVYRLYFSYDIANNIDTALLSPKDYVTIFGDIRSHVPRSQRRLSVVKISIGGRSIHRRYLGERICDQTYVGLNHSSIAELISTECYTDELLGKEVSISKGSTLLYYWNHPFHATRLTARLGVFSIVFTTIISIITALLK